MFLACESHQTELEVYWVTDWWSNDFVTGLWVEKFADIPEQVDQCFWDSVQNLMRLDPIVSKCLNISFDHVALLCLGLFGVMIKVPDLEIGCTCTCRSM